MQIQFDVPELQSALSLVTRALSARASVPALNCVLIETGGDAVTLTCSDGELTIRTSLPAQVSEQGGVLLPAKLFSELIRKLPCPRVTMEIDGGSAIFRYLDSVTRLGCFPAADFPECRELAAQYTLTMSNADLRDAVTKTAFAASTDPGRKILTGCLVEVRRDQTRFVALDGYRLAIATVQGVNPPTPEDKPLLSVFPGRALTEIGRMLQGGGAPVTIELSATRALCRFGETAVYTSLMVGEFINYEQILPHDEKTRVRIARAEFMSAIERASIVAREGLNNMLRMRVEHPHEDNDRLTVLANTERASVREEVACESYGDPIDIAFNASYLTEIMRIISDEYIWLNFITNVSPCVIAPDEGNAYLYLVLPVRTFTGA